MEREELDELMSIDLETRRDAEVILFALEQAPDGFNTTTYRQLEAQFGCHVDVAERYLFDLHAAIMLLSEAHGLKLDMSRHRNKEEGLPFSLDYDVWHRKDAASNGMFDDEASPENRDWRDEHEDMISDAMAGILAKALPAYVIPPKLRFGYGSVPACDAEILDVYCEFETAGLLFFLNFELYTGRGGTWIFLEPEPSVEGVSLIYKGMDDDFTAAWDPDASKWDRPLPLGR
mgnify:CR=1 FL=1